MEKSFQYYNTRISYNLYGDGDVVVLLHGFGEDSRIFNDQVNFLKQNYKVLIPDLPGTGKSDLLKKDNVTIDDYAECVHELLQHEGVTSCKLLGHSMGGYITLAFAEKYPQLLTGFGLIHSSASSDDEEKRKSRTHGIKLIKEYGAFSFLKNTIPNLFGEHFKKNNAGKVDELIEQSRQFSKEALIQYYTAMMNRPDRIKVLENTSIPVLFVLGKEDVAAPLHIVINQVQLPRVSVIHILDNVGHMGMLEASDDLNDYLNGFVSAEY